MKAPCGVRRAGHLHRLTWLEPHRDHTHPRGFTERCNSQHLWATAARALLLGQEPTLDGKPLVWAEARAYLDTCPATYRRGVPA